MLTKIACTIEISLPNTVNVHQLHDLAYQHPDTTIELNLEGGPQLVVRACVYVPSADYDEDVAPAFAAEVLSRVPSPILANSVPEITMAVNGGKEPAKTCPTDCN